MRGFVGIEEFIFENTAFLEFWTWNYKEREIQVQMKNTNTTHHFEFSQSWYSSFYWKKVENFKMMFSVPYHVYPCYHTYTAELGVPYRTRGEGTIFSWLTNKKNEILPIFKNFTL